MTPCGVTLSFGMMMRQQVRGWSDDTLNGEIGDCEEHERECGQVGVFIVKSVVQLSSMRNYISGLPLCRNRWRYIRCMQK